jgi:hypothetical protein
MGEVWGAVDVVGAGERGVEGGEVGVGGVVGGEWGEPKVF